MTVINPLNIKYAINDEGGLPKIIAGKGSKINLNPNVAGCYLKLVSNVMSSAA